MTIRFLRQWNGYDDQDVVSLPSSEENRLVNAGIATFNINAERSGMTFDEVVSALGGGSGGSAYYVTPEDYGCVGNGSTDDAANFQLALNAAVGGVLRLTEGKTYLLRNVSIPGAMVIEADGNATLKYGGTNGTVAPLETIAAIMYAEGSSGSPFGQIIVRGINFVGIRSGSNYDPIAAGAHDGIQFNYCLSPILEKCTFTDIIQDPVTFANSPGAVAQNNIVTRCGDAAFEIRLGSGMKIINNVCVGVRHLVATKPNVNDCIVSGNIAETHDIGILAHGSNWLIDGNTITAYTSADGRNGATAAGIEISDRGGAFTPTAINNLTISNNNLSGRTGSGGSGITIPAGATAYTVSDVRISGNNLTSVTGVGLAVGSNITIEKNIMTCSGSSCAINTGTVGDVTVDNNTIVNSGSSIGINTVAPRTTARNNRITTSTGTAISFGSAAVDSVAESNTISSGAIGITVFGQRARVNANKITTTAGAGISLNNADHSVIGNVISAAAEGINIISSAVKNVLSSNRITAATQGVRVAASNCVLSGNIISGASFWGVNISAGAVNTLVVGNNLLGNTSGAITDAGTTTSDVNNIKV